MNYSVDTPRRQTDFDPCSSIECDFLDAFSPKRDISLKALSAQLLGVEMFVYTSQEGVMF